MAEADTEAALNAYERLYGLLSDAYWKASTIEGKDRIRGLADAIYDILTRVNAAEIGSRTAEFKSLANEVSAVNARLDALKTEIDQIIAVVKLATDIANAADQAISRAAKALA